MLKWHEHWHKCANPNCGHSWHHGNWELNNLQAHLCPNCGMLQWDQYVPGQNEEISLLRSEQNKAA